MPSNVSRERETQIIASLKQQLYMIQCEVGTARHMLQGLKPDQHVASFSEENREVLQTRVQEIHASQQSVMKLQVDLLAHEGLFADTALINSLIQEIGKHQDMLAQIRQQALPQLDLEKLNSDLINLKQKKQDLESALARVRPAPTTVLAPRIIMFPPPVYQSPLPSSAGLII